MMARQPITEADILRHLSSQAMSPEDQALKSKLFREFVDDFAARTIVFVRSGLKSESTSAIADEWIEEATSAIRTLAPESSSDLERDPDFSRASEWMRTELNEQLCREMLKPSEEDIRRESVELSQCLMANWFSLLEHSKQDEASKPVHLDASGVPKEYSTSDLLRGVEAFPVGRDDVLDKFHEFLRARFLDGKTAQLAPSLFLTRQIDGTYEVTAVDTNSEAALEETGIFEGVVNLLDKNQAPADADLASIPPYAQHVLARAAAKIAQASDIRQSIRSTIRKIKRQSMEMQFATALAEIEASKTLSESLATMVINDIGDALSPNFLNPVRAWQKHNAMRSLRDAAANAVSNNTVSSLRTISKLASGYLVVCEAHENEARPTEDIAGLIDILKAYPTAPAVLYQSAVAAHKVTLRPEAFKLGRKMCARLDVSGKA
jgi:hypothetical protein